VLNAGKSSGCQKTNGLVDHVLVRGSPQPRWADAGMALSFAEFSDQESPAGFEDPVHLDDGSLLIILSYVVQGEGARHRVEAGVSEWKPLRESGLKVCRQSMPAGSRRCQLDHLSGCIDPIDGPGRSYSRGEHHRQTAAAAPNVENAITVSQLQIVSEHRPESPSPWPEQPDCQVVDPRPVDRMIAAGVMCMAMNHRNLLGSSTLALTR
jgi:hypothetical protein